MKKFGIYIQFPFCPTRCHFCSFGTHVYHAPSVNRYLDALKREIRFYGENPRLKEYEAETLYLGGGTPTLAPEEIPPLIEEIRRHFQVSPKAEISLEAHPGALSQKDLRIFRESGFNRLTLGVQSFSEEDLLAMNRGHGAEDSRRAYHQARSEGFENVALDLIYGMPGQTLGRWEEELEEAIGMGPEHLSVYGLTIEEDTVFHYLREKGKFKETDEETQAAMYLSARKKIRESGYRHYEISNYAREGFECRHNLLYWTQGEFLGLGASASSYLGETHFSNVESVDGYIRKVEMEGSGAESPERLAPEKQFREALVFGLRKCSGVRLSQMKAAYRPFFPAVLPMLSELSKEGFLQEEDCDLFHLSERGLLLADHVSQRLI